MKPTYSFSLALGVAVLLWCTPTRGRDIYVDNVGGDDIHMGHTPVATGDNTGPCRTIQRAMRIAAKGDRIILANSGQPYRESITLSGGRHSGWESRPFEIVGNGAVLDGSAPVPVGGWHHEHGNVFRFQPRRMGHAMLFLDGKPPARRLVTETGTLPELKPLEWSLLDGHIYFRVEENRIPHSYSLRYAREAVGITLFEVRHVLIRDLTIQGFRLDGVNSHDSVFDATLTGLVCRGNGRSGISIGGASRVTVDTSLVGNNGTAQLRTEGHSITYLVRSDLIDNTAPALVQDGGRVIGKPLQP